MKYSKTSTTYYDFDHSHELRCSIFSMDGDFAPILQLVELRKKHKFLLAIDDVSILVT